MFKRKMLVIAFVICIFNARNIFASETNLFPKSSISEEASDTAIIFFLQPYVKSAVNTYYSDYMSKNPNTALFYTNISSIEPNKSVSTSYNIIVDVLPYVGAHILIGKDRVQLLLDSEGNVKVVAFDHVESYDISEFPQIKDIFTKPLPEPVKSMPK